MARQRVLIYDIDGVVANSQPRFVRSGALEALANKDYNQFRKCMRTYAEDNYDDEPIVLGFELIDRLIDLMGIDRAVALTARNSWGREQTLAYLQVHCPWPMKAEDLIMGPTFPELEPGVYYREGEPRFDAVDFKRTETLKLQIHNDVVMAVDDCHEISMMYWQLGIPAITLMIPEVDQGNTIQSAISACAVNA